MARKIVHRRAALKKGRSPKVDSRRRIAQRPLHAQAHRNRALLGPRDVEQALVLRLLRPPLAVLRKAADALEPQPADQRLAAPGPVAVLLQRLDAGVLERDVETPDPVIDPVARVAAAARRDPLQRIPYRPGRIHGALQLRRRNRPIWDRSEERRV